MRYTLNDFENYIKKNTIEKLFPETDLKIKLLEFEAIRDEFIGREFAHKELFFMQKR